MVCSLTGLPAVNSCIDLGLYGAIDLRKRKITHSDFLACANAGLSFFKLRSGNCSQRCCVLLINIKNTPDSRNYILLKVVHVHESQIYSPRSKVIETSAYGCEKPFWELSTPFIRVTPLFFKCALSPQMICKRTFSNGTCVYYSYKALRHLINTTFTCFMPL